MKNSHTSAFLTRYWLAAAIGITVILAWLFPGPALALPKVHALDVGVIVIMFLGSLKLAPSRFKKAASQPHLILISLAAVFIAAPLISLGLAFLFGFDQGSDQLAVLICSAQASTLATGIVLTEVAGGDVALAMVFTLVNNFLTVVFTPLIFRVLGRTVIEVDHTAMGLEIALKIVLPVIVAQAVRGPLADFTKRHSRKLSITSQLIILMYIYAGVAAGIERLLGRSSALPKVLALVVILHIFLLFVNSVVARITMRSAGQRTAFVLCSSQKTLPAAMLIWKSYFPTLPLGPIIAVTYHLTQLVVDSILAPGFRKLPLVRDRKS
ncbi:MAG: bile acid:sodium symporter [Proteobacteria bacterium]|nr:bile acid:sodium symporter [Pseudomonadota bacterium]